jgi:hypothetical protein
MATINTSFSTRDLSRDIIDLSARIGKMEGIAEEKGFPDSPIAPKVDGGQIALRYFENQHATLRSMRVDLDAIYQRIQLVSTDCSLVPNAKVRGIFEEQIQVLHERRALLDMSLRNFSHLLNSHCELKNVISTFKQLESLVNAREQYDLGLGAGAEIIGKLEKLKSDVHLILPRWKREGPEFCNVHFNAKKEISDQINLLILKLNLKKINERDEIEHTAGEIPCVDRIIQEIEDNPVNTPALALPSFTVVLQEISSLQMRSLLELKQRILEIQSARFDFGEKETIVSALLDVAEKNGMNLNRPNGVYYWVWFIAHEKDSRAGGDHWGETQAPKDLDRLVEAIDRSI